LKACLSTAPGGPETTGTDRAATAEPRKGKVRIRVRAGGAETSLTTLIIKVFIQMKPHAHFCPGGEVAGECVTPWERAFSNVSVGDRVLAMTGFLAALRQTSLLTAERVYEYPRRMPYDEAHGPGSDLWEPHITSLKTGAEIQPGESFADTWRCGCCRCARSNWPSSGRAGSSPRSRRKKKRKFCRDLRRR